MEKDLTISAEVDPSLGMTEIKSVITTQHLEAGAVLKILGREEEFLVYDPFSSIDIRRGNADSIRSILAEIAHKKNTWKGTIPGPKHKDAA